MREEEINLISNSNPQFYCQIHQQKVKLFCQDCNTLICSLCISQHPFHEISKVSNIIENEKQSLIDLINQVSFYFFFHFKTFIYINITFLFFYFSKR